MNNVQNRVNRLNLDNERAQRQLEKTIRMNEIADEIKQRKQEDQMFRERWLNEKERNRLE